VRHEPGQWHRSAGFGGMPHGFASGDGQWHVGR
jgi:hypothetical protein